MGTNRSEVLHSLPPDAAGSGAPVLVTGAAGFAGCFLVEALVRRGERVVGISRRGAWPARWSHLATHAELHAVDLAEAGPLAALLARCRPDRVYHLAGFSHAGESVRDPDAAWHGNAAAAEGLYEALAASSLAPRVLHVSSGLVYAPPADDAPLDESSPLGPQTPYARSKVAAEEVAHRQRRERGLAVVLARPFNHTGPGQSPQFAIPSFARQLAAIAAGTLAPVLQTGNLDVRRDLSDVRDVVEAYVALMEHGRDGEVYNVASGESVPLRRVVEYLAALAGAPVEIRPRPDLMRPGEPACIRVCIDRLRRETGWQPRHTLEETLADTLAAWQHDLPQE